MMAAKHIQHANSSMLSNVVVTGGTFIQHHAYSNRKLLLNFSDRYQFAYMAAGGLDLLQNATASGAFHNSGERYDPPKCHPNTRTAVMKTIMDWMLGIDEESRGKFIMWITGAAGAGKSAILQSYAEQQDSEGRLLASFFFGKSNPDRNHARKLMATIAYQIHAKIPDARQHMIVAIEQDPLIFTRTLLTQFMTLIIQPLRDAFLFESRFFDQPHAPRLIVIDGLDECIDQKEQKDILMTISKVTHECLLPISFLIASRPEHDIQTTFSSSYLLSICTRVDLDERFSPENDIELYLRHELNDIKTNHPFRRFLPSSWPSDKDVKELVRKSSGQFIYIATVVKYVESTRHRPHHRLDVILSIRPGMQPTQNPFAELDALYTHILSNVDDDDVSVVLRVLCFIFGCEFYAVDAEQIESILALEYGQIPVTFCNLGALISIANDSPDSANHKIKILHASLRDFLYDPERSGIFHIHTAYMFENLVSCVRFLTRTDYRSANKDMVLWYISAAFVRENIENLHTKFTTSLIHELREFSIPLYYELSPRIQVFHSFHNIFLPVMLSFLKNSDLEEAKVVYKHHLRLLRETFLSQLKSVNAYHSKSSSNGHFALHLALVCHYPCLSPHSRHDTKKAQPVPRASLMSEFRLFDWEYPDGERTLDTYASRAGLVYAVVNQQTAVYCSNYIKLLSHLCPFGRLDRFESVVDPALAKSWRIFGKEVYAGAARCSFEYLCSIKNTNCSISSPQRRFKAYASAMIRHSPWKWRRNYGSQGSCRARKHYRLVRPLEYWYQDSPLTLLSKNPIIRKTRSKPIYFHAYFTSPELDMNDPIVFDRVQSEKYLLALGYLFFFLPMAGKSEALLQLCRTRAFSRRCCEYPKRTKEARRAVADYLARMEVKQEA